MHPPAIIIEDNDDKTSLIFHQYKHLFAQRNIHLFRHPDSACDFMTDFIGQHNPPSGLVLVIDNDLGVPGYPAGITFLEYAIGTHCNRIEMVIITTQSIEARVAMKKLCDANDIRSEIFKAF